MNATEWVYEATLDMPTELRDRVRAETLDHLTEADMRHAADVTPVLGEARKVNRELRRLYLTEREWNKVMTGPANARTWALFPFLIWLVLDNHRNFFPGVSQGLILLFVTLFLVLTQQLHPVRRARWHLQLLSLFALMMGVLTGWPRGSVFLPLWLWGGMFGYSFLQTAFQDQRLKRTLQILSPSTNAT